MNTDLPLFHIVAINERNRYLEVLTSEPLPHHAACTMMGKFQPAEDVRIQLLPLTYQRS